MATRESIAGAQFEAAAFWNGREPFHVRDPRLEPVMRDKLSDPVSMDTVVVTDVDGFDGGKVSVTREDQFGAIKRYRFALEDWRNVARKLRVIHVAGYQAGESAPGRVLS